MKKTLLLSGFIAVLFVTILSGAAFGQSLQVDKRMYNPGERITVYFQAQPGYAQDAWIGIIPSNVPHGQESVNDQYDLTYQYLKGQTSGTLIFTAPQPGAYDLRMHDTDKNGHEVASVSFTVSSGSSGGVGLTLNSTWFSPGAQIQVMFRADGNWPRDAWVGIIPSNVPHGQESVNDQYDLSYKYLERRTSGTLTFTAPTNPGNYDFRMHDTDNNGREAASISFMVK